MPAQRKIEFLPHGDSMRRKSTPRSYLPYQVNPARVGRWTILDHNAGAKWFCRCDCGTERLVARHNLQNGRSRGCGCERKETSKARLTTHGLSRTKGYARLFNLSNFSKYLYQRCRRECRYKDLPFDLDLLDVEIPDICPVLGIPLQPQENGRGWNTPTLDRIVPEKGYVKGNVVVVSWRANWLKSSATMEEIAMLHAFYVNREQ